MPSEAVINVGDLNRYVKGMLDGDPLLRNVRVRGEISNLSRPGFSGHIYFTLKDAGGQLRCAMFRTDVQRMSMTPKDGQRVIAQGSCSLYAERGDFQLYVKAMRPDGVGSLFEQYEALKQRLEAEGLFSQSRKRPLPLRPQKVAVVTAATGAVIHDVCRVAGARDASIPLVLVPTKVQGEGAAAEIAAALRRAAKIPGVDVVILCRGGGSLEDLWAFNEEAVARAIAACPIPVVSAVGHETDFTISDFTADVRAATPSNAAEIVIPTRAELLSGLEAAAGRLTRAMEGRLDAAEKRILRLRSRLEAHRPENQLVSLRSRLDQAAGKLDAAMTARITQGQAETARLSEALDRAAGGRLEREENRLAQLRVRLEALNPRAVLSRGYALITAEGRLVPTAGAAAACSKLQINFSDGSLPVAPLEKGTDHADKEEGKL